MKLTLDNTPLAGYQFSDYAVSEGSLSGSDNPYTLVMPDADVTVNLSTQNLVAIDWAEKPTFGDGRSYFPSTVSDCHATSTVIIHATRKTTYTHGGIVGYNYIDCEVSDCTSAAKISGNPDYNEFTYFGGVVGWNYKGTLRRNLAIGSIVTTVWDYSHGAICGRNNDGTFENNYYQACTVAGTAKATNVGIGNITLVASEGPGDLTDNNGAVPTLRDDADNSVALGLLARLATAGINGSPLDLGWGACKYPMQLAGRTLYKDGAWNTLCLPFDVTVGSDVMEGATAMTLNGSTSGFDSESGVLTLNFVGVGEGSTIAAGTPFIVKWTGEDVTNPVFSGVTISGTAASSVTSTDGTVSFRGSYSPVTLAANDRSKLYLSAENKLYWPSVDKTIGTCRAYFEMSGGQEARTIVLNFGDETSSIHNARCTMHNEAGAWYDLQGRRLVGKPTKAGLYIHGGNKVVVK